MIPVFAAAALVLTQTPSPHVGLLRELTADVEIGPGYVVQNDNQYGATGTPYSAADVGGS